MVSRYSAPRKRSQSLAYRDDDSYLPEFLQDSPYLPVGLGYDPEPRAPKQTLGQVLRSKKVRRIIIWIAIAIVSLTILKSARRMIIRRWFSGPACLKRDRFIPTMDYLQDEGIDWSRYAYSQYATDKEYLCNAVMLFATLDQLGSKAARLLMYPSLFDADTSSLDMSAERRLLQKAKDDYNVNLVPIKVQHRTSAYRLWADSYTKLLAFNQTQYSRLLVLDSDSTVLQHMDELFFVPPAPVVVPRAYWLSKPMLSSHIMVIQPSEHDFKRVQKAIKKASGTVYDMEIVNSLFGETCIALPHQQYALLTGEFRREKHKQYLEENEKWDPQKVINEAKFVHFSDDPFPKPWIDGTEKMMAWATPDCVVGPSESEDCRAREIWLNLYSDFKNRRKGICGEAAE